MSGEKKDWTRVEVEELISCYREHECLWNAQIKQYRDKTERLNALNTISEIFNTTREEIQRKIHNLRNQFNIELKKSLEKRGSKGTNDETLVSKWHYYQSLMFCKQSLQSNPALAENLIALESNDEVNVNYDHESKRKPYEDTKPFSKQQYQETIRCRIKKLKLDNETRNEEFSKEATHSIPQKGDQFDTFGSFVADELRSIKSEFLQRKLKRKIQEIILEVTEEDEQCSSF